MVTRVNTWRSSPTPHCVGTGRSLPEGLGVFSPGTGTVSVASLAWWPQQNVKWLIAYQVQSDCCRHGYGSIPSEVMLGMFTNEPSWVHGGVFGVVQSEGEGGVGVRPQSGQQGLASPSLIVAAIPPIQYYSHMHSINGALVVALCESVSWDVWQAELVGSGLSHQSHRLKWAAVTWVCHPHAEWLC